MNHLSSARQRPHDMKRLRLLLVRKAQGAFTLLEIMCAVAVVAFLATAVIITMSPARNKAERVKQRLQNQERELQRVQNPD